MKRIAAFPDYWVGFIFTSDSIYVKEDDLRMSHIRFNSPTKIFNFVLLKYC